MRAAVLSPGECQQREQPAYCRAFNVSLQLLSGASCSHAAASHLQLQGRIRLVMNRTAAH